MDLYEIDVLNRPSPRLALKIVFIRVHEVYPRGSENSSNSYKVIIF